MKQISEERLSFFERLEREARSILDRRIIKGVLFRSPAVRVDNLYKIIEEFDNEFKHKSDG